MQNVGDSQVTFVSSQCVYINGVLDPNAELSKATMDKGETVSITTSMTVQSGATYVVRVVTEEGTFTEATKTFD